MKRIISIFALSCLVAFLSWTNAANAGQNSLAADQAAFQSQPAQQARSSGSPVGPPVKVTLCQNGHTISVAATAVPGLLAQGATLGPCPGDISKGNNGVGNGVDPQPPGNPPINDGPGTGPGNPGR